MPRKKKVQVSTEPRKSKSTVFEWKGVQQFGDMALYGKNPGAHATQHYVPFDVVGPGDIVDDIDPSKQYTFYKFEPTSNVNDAARELDRLRRAGWFKCEAPRFISPTGKFETKDNALVLGNAVYYAQPYARKLANRKAAREFDGPMAVAAQLSSIADSGKRDGFEATAEARGDTRGQRAVE